MSNLAIAVSLQRARLSRLSLGTALIIAGISSTMKPVLSGVTTSGTAPLLNAMTGVPHAIASIITMPNGSSHSMGNSNAFDLERK